jgi:hypothetical protein
MLVTLAAMPDTDPLRSSARLTFRAESPILPGEEREVFAMPEFSDALGASKAVSSLLVLFIPSKDRGDKAID